MATLVMLDANLDQGALGYLPVRAAGRLPLGQSPAKKSSFSLQLLLRQYLHGLNTQIRAVVQC